MSIKGSCLCGTVTFAVTGQFQLAGNCHCSICRRSHGAAYATWGIIEPGQFQWTAGEDSVRHYETSPGRTRCFCQRCGSPLATTHNGAIGEVVMGCVDDAAGMAPTAHIFVGSRAPWHDITDALPQFDEWPPGMEP